jgi:hypothetical protein
MVRVNFEAVGLDLPSLADKLVGCFALQGLQPSCTVVSQKEGMEMLLQLMG